MKGGPLHVVVAGAGLGGLCAAAWLRQAGHRVTLLEASPSVGGKAGTLSVNGYRFDTGPTLLTLPSALREAFAAVGATLDDDVHLERLEPVCRYFFPGGKRFDVTGDTARTAAAIDSVFPGEGPAYRKLMERSAYFWRHAGEPYLEAPFRSQLDFVGRVLKRGPGAMGLAAGLGSLDSLASSLFRAPELQAFAGRFATYVGGDPEHSSAAYAMIPHLEHELGAWRPRGGIHAIALALADRLRAAGVTVRTGSPVREVVLAGARVTAVRVGDEPEPLACDALVANVDPELVLGSWLGPQHSRLAREAGLERVTRRQRSLSGYALLLGLRGEAPPGLAHHNVYFARDYRSEFSAIFERSTVCFEPTVYVCNPGPLEPDAAPAGCAALFVLVNAPAVADRPGLGGVDPGLEDRVLARLDELVPGLSSRVAERARITQRDLGALGSPGGAIYGEAPHGAQAPFRRQPQRCEPVRGLYFVGGSVHPGGGVPMVALGGKHVATLVKEDAKMLSAGRTP